MDEKEENLAFWLVPSAGEERIFAALISDLAERFDAPVFNPHLTLHGGSISEATALTVLRSLPAQVTYELEVDGVYVSECFTKTLFVRFRVSEELKQLRVALAGALRLPTNSDFDPHLSLLYKEMPLSVKTELARETTLPFRVASFVGLSVIAHPVEIKNREDVEAWRTIARRSFAEGSR